MFDVIDFLDHVGSDASLRNASRDELAVALAMAQADPVLSRAILGKDGQPLDALLGEDAFCCYINPGKEDEDEEDEEETEEETEDVGVEEDLSQSDKTVASSRLLHALTSPT